MIVRHHLLECILWPNKDGTFRKIINTQKRLEELGVYNDWKLIIRIERGAHSTMHHEFKKGTEYDLSERFSGKKNPMYGKSGIDSPRWHGDNVCPHQKMMRARKEFSKGNITKEDLRKVFDEWNVYQNWYRREKRANRI
jgi:hypothetical protein